MKDLRELLKETDNKVLMTVFPHPDDETMATGGLLLVAKQMGWKTVVVSLTGGEAGKNFVCGNRKSIKEIRVGELEKATKILKADEVVLGGFGDGKLRMNQQEWQTWVLGLINKYQPGLVVTYDPSGISGHPDHIALSVFSGSLKTKVLWATLPENVRFAVNPLVKSFLAEPDYQLNIGRNCWGKWRAARAHASQKLGKGMSLPLLWIFAIWHYEWYHLVDEKRKYPYKYVNFEI
jgi:LmbE family N-acetylglucosaminyl deacetylase